MTATTGGLTPEQMLEQERRLVLPSLSNDDAIDLGQLVLARARERELPVVIEVRRGASLLFRAALPGAVPDNDEWLARKLAVIERFGHSTMHERVRHEAAGTTFHEATGLSQDSYAAHGGAFPLAVAGTGMVGVLAVSGLPQVQDHELVVECLEAYLAGRA